MGYKESTHSTEGGNTPRGVQNSKILNLHNIKEKVTETLNLTKILKKNETSTPREDNIEEQLHDEEPQKFEIEEDSAHDHNNEFASNHGDGNNEQGEIMDTLIYDENDGTQISNVEEIDEALIGPFQNQDDEPLYRDESKDNYVSAKNSESRGTTNTNESIKDNNAIAGNDEFKEANETLIKSMEYSEELEVAPKNETNQMDLLIQDSETNTKAQDMNDNQSEESELEKEITESFIDEVLSINPMECLKINPEMNLTQPSEESCVEHGVESKIIEEKEKEAIENDLNEYQSLNEEKEDIEYENNISNEDLKDSFENVHIDEVSMDRNKLNHSNSGEISVREKKEFVEEKKEKGEELEETSPNNDKFDLSFSLNSSFSNLAFSQKSSSIIHSSKQIEHKKSIVPPVNLKPIINKEEKVEIINSGNSEPKVNTLRAESNPRNTKEETIHSHKKVIDLPTIPESSRNENSSRNKESVRNNNSQRNNDSSRNDNSFRNKDSSRNKESARNKENMKKEILSKEATPLNSNRSHAKDARQKHSVSQKTNALASYENTKKEQNAKCETYFNLFDINKKKVSVFSNFINEDEGKEQEGDIAELKKTSNMSASESVNESDSSNEESSETETDSTEHENNSENRYSDEPKEYAELSGSSENNGNYKMNNHFTEFVSPNNSVFYGITKKPMEIKKNSLNASAKFGKLQVKVSKMPAPVSNPHIVYSKGIPKYSATKINDRRIVQKKMESNVQSALSNSSNNMYREGNTSYAYDNQDYRDSRYLDNPRFATKDSRYNKEYLSYNYPSSVLPPPNNDYYNNTQFSAKRQKKTTKSIGIQTETKKLQNKEVNTINFMLTTNKEKEELPNLIFQPTLKLPQYDFNALTAENGRIVSKHADLVKEAFSNAE